MLEVMKGLPDNVIGIHATGDVKKDDYENVLIPCINEVVEKQGEINYLLVLETDIKNFTASAWFEDIKLGIKNFSKWHKIAVVTDQKIVERLSDVFNFFIPGKSKGFKFEEIVPAIKWVSAKD